MAKATTVVDVILGEAGGKTPEQRYEDMKAIASAIVNRANALGVPVEDVVGVRSEFNAYGKPLPRGVENYRSVAEQALSDVLENGPAHNATFYATPSAVDNLPGGLSPVTETVAHQFFNDPQNRAIRTTQGYQQPSQAIFTSYAPTGEAEPSPFDALFGGYASQVGNEEPQQGLLAESSYSSPFGLLGDRITSDYGWRTPPRTGLGRLGSAYHRGVDLSLGPGVSGYPIESANEGVVSYAGEMGGLGNTVELQHPDGMRTRYSHLGELGNVAVGDEVARGTPLGMVGNTGNSANPHLHFSMIDQEGNSVDPERVMAFNPEVRVPTPTFADRWSSAVPGEVQRDELAGVPQGLLSQNPSTLNAFASMEGGMTPPAGGVAAIDSIMTPQPDMGAMQAEANRMRQDIERRNTQLQLSPDQLSDAMRRRETALGLLGQPQQVARYTPTISNDPLSPATQGLLAALPGPVQGGMNMFGLQPNPVTTSLVDPATVGSTRISPEKPVDADYSIEATNPGLTNAGLTGVQPNAVQTTSVQPTIAGPATSEIEPSQTAHTAGRQPIGRVPSRMGRMAGGVAGAVGGGLLGGPVGALLGGLLGREMANGKGLFSNRGLVTDGGFFGNAANPPAISNLGSGAQAGWAAWGTPNTIGTATDGSTITNFGDGLVTRTDPNGVRTTFRDGRIVDSGDGLLSRFFGGNDDSRTGGVDTSGFSPGLW